MPRLILTHPGGAHKDDFLACSLLVSDFGLAIERREPTAEDLESVEVCVVDVGGEWDAERRNFDHHQFPRDSEPLCALSLVLKSMGLYEEARTFCDWLEPAEWFDTRGPVNTAKWLGIDPGSLSRLNSPIDITMLRRFADAERLEPGEPLWEVMKMIGDDLREYLAGMRKQLDDLERVADFWVLENGREILFIPRENEAGVNSSFGADRLIRQMGKEEVVLGMVYPDRRGEGYGLGRFRDCKDLDYTRIEGEEDVHFAHVQGFVAKVTATEVGRLKELVEMAVVGEPMRQGAVKSK